MSSTKTEAAKPLGRDAADQVLDQMFGYYTRERPISRPKSAAVVTDLDSRAAA